MHTIEQCKQRIDQLEAKLHQLELNLIDLQTKTDTNHKEIILINAHILAIGDKIDDVKASLDKITPTVARHNVLVDATSKFIWLVIGAALTIGFRVIFLGS